MFFEYLPTVEYKFSKNDIKEIENLVISVAPVDSIYTDHHFDNTVIGGETPEEIATNLYRNPIYYWNLLYINRVVNPFTEWVKNPQELEEYCLNKYGSYEEMHGIKHFYDLRTRDILVGVAEDKIYKYMEENENEIPMGIGKVTYYDYEQELNDERRNIRYIPESKLLAFNDKFENGIRMSYK